MREKNDNKFIQVFLQIKYSIPSQMINNEWSIQDDSIFIFDSVTHFLVLWEYSLLFTFSD